MTDEFNQGSNTEKDTNAGQDDDLQIATLKRQFNFGLFLEDPSGNFSGTAYQQAAENYHKEKTSDIRRQCR